MKAALLIESLTGNTQKAGDRIANDLQQVGWTITGVSRVKLPDFGSIQEADMIIVGTWVHGLTSRNTCSLRRDATWRGSEPVVYESPYRVQISRTRGAIWAYRLLGRSGNRWCSI